MEIDGAICSVSFRFKEVEADWCTFQVTVNNKTFCDGQYDRKTGNLALRNEKLPMTNHDFFVNGVIMKASRKLHLREQCAMGSGQPVEPSKPAPSISGPDWAVYKLKRLTHTV